MKTLKVQLVSKVIPDVEGEFPLTKQMKKMFKRDSDINKLRVREACIRILKSFNSVQSIQEFISFYTPNSDKEYIINMFKASVKDHDASKFYYPEYYGMVLKYARDTGLISWSYGGNQVDGAIKNAELHHWGKNPHHLEHWMFIATIAEMPLYSLLHWFCDYVYAECIQKEKSGVSTVDDYFKYNNFSDIQKRIILELLTLFPEINY